MSLRRAPRTGRLGMTTLALAAVGFGLTGCLSPDPVPVGGAGASVAAAATELPVPAESASAKPTPTIVGMSTGLTCDDVLSADDLYALKGGANLSHDPNAKPASGTMAARLVALNGISCVYVNNSSGEKFTVGVSKPTQASMPLVKSTIASEQGAKYRVSSYSGIANTVGYFRVYNGIGLASVATSAYWFSVSSDTFESATDAKQIVLRIEKSLPD